MEQNNKYIAITIGPISDTMSCVTKPAALWATSFMFSYITKSICIKLCEKIPACNFVTPFVPEKDTEDYRRFFEREDGVGIFHDHIIFKAVGSNGKPYTVQDFAEIKKAVIADVSEKFYINDDGYLTDHIMISACEFDVAAGENPILKCGKMLDCLELSKTFVPAEKSGKILNAFKNENLTQDIEKRFGILQENWQLWDSNDKHLRDTGSIAAAANAPHFKKNKYLCVLRADGDNMSQIIGSLTSSNGGDNKNIDEKCREFSKACLEYCSAVAEIVKAFGGVTIYAGGDDLLALVPCQYGQKTVFGLLGEIDRKFNESFNAYIEQINDDDKKPSLSIGLFICYHEYPLYEALDRSAELLFKIAKSGKKNNVAVELRKHSGQSMELRFSKKENGQDNSAFNKATELLDTVIKSCYADTDEVLLSAAQKLLLFKKLFEASAGDKNAISELFNNTFDSSFHARKELEKFLYTDLPLFMYEQCPYIRLYENDVMQTRVSADKLAQVLRLFKFFVEKGGRE